VRLRESAHALLTPRASGHLKDQELPTYAQLADLFATGQQRGEIRSDIEPVQLAEVLTGVFQLTTTNWLTGWWEHESEDLEARLLRAVNVFLTGCQTLETSRRYR